MRFAFVTLASVAIMGCVAGPSYDPVARYDGRVGGPERGGGVLIREGDCLYMAEERLDFRYLLAFPSEGAAWDGARNRLEFDGVYYRLGEYVVFTGGEIRDDSTSWVSAPDNHCDRTRVWRVNRAVEPPEPLPAIADRSQPFWYTKYFDYEGQLPVFRGDVAGMPVGAESGPNEACQLVRTVVGDAALAAIAGTPMDVTLDSLPRQAKLFGPPIANLCADGTVVRVSVQFEEVGGIRGSASLDRVAGFYWIRQEASARRWSEGMIAGRPAALLSPVLDRIGQSGVFVRDDETAGMTQLLGAGTTLEELVALMEALYH